MTIETWLGTETLTPFESAQGYEITLDAVELGIDHLYFVTGDPVGGSVSRLSWVSVAHAHPGHYAAGDTLGEMDEPKSLDLLGESRRLTRRPGVTGDAHSCVLRFGQLDAHDAAVYVSGRAAKDDQVIRFEAMAALDELLNSASDLPEVPGVPLDDGFIDSDGRMTFSASPSVWLDQVDFSQLTPTDDDDEPLHFEADTQPQNSFVRGVLKAVAYHVTYDELT